jgi:hypothetical protein
MKQRFLFKSDIGIIKLSHMSVKDYLISRHRVASTGFGINERLSHSLIAKTCLAYLLQFENLDMLNQNTIGRHPLAQYAAEYWVMHVHFGAEESTDIQQEKLIMTLFQPWPTVPFISWVKMHDIDHLWGIIVEISDIPLRVRSDNVGFVLLCWRTTRFLYTSF